MTTLGLALNEDDSHFYGSRTEKEMTREGLTAFVDQYAGTQISHLFLNPNGQRTEYRSKVWDAIWDLKDQAVIETVATGEGPERWIRNARLLDEQGLNPYSVWIGRCREKGISPWLSMRMNDIHDVHEPTSFMHSTFWVKHPEYWRVPYSNDPQNWGDRAFDYARPEVREYHMKLVREYLERFDADGLELDWMRFGLHFKPGHERPGADILTAFMREVRGLANAAASRWGHPVKVGARVPANPIVARETGMDGVRWAREGLVDMLVVTPFFSTSDFDIPIELWRALLGPANGKIILAAGHEILLRPYPEASQRINDPETVRGFAAAHLDRGADQIYLFNYMDKGLTVEGAEEYRTVLTQTLSEKPRRHVLTFTDTWPVGVARPCRLPAKLEGKSPQQFRLYTGPKPTGGQAVMRVGLKDAPGIQEAGFSARLNAEECKPLPDATNPDQFSETKRMVQFDIPLAAMQKGYNLAEIWLKDGEAQQIVWVEIRIDPMKK